MLWSAKKRTASQGWKQQNETLFKTFEMTILEEDGKLIANPIASGSFFYHLGPKKVNIETGEIINKVKYDLYNYTIDLTSIN